MDAQDQKKDIDIKILSSVVTQEPPKAENRFVVTLNIGYTEISTISDFYEDLHKHATVETAKRKNPTTNDPYRMLVCTGGTILPGEDVYTGLPIISIRSSGVDGKLILISRESKERMMRMAAHNLIQSSVINEVTYCTNNLAPRIVKVEGIREGFPMGWTKEVAEANIQMFYKIKLNNYMSKDHIFVYGTSSSINHSCNPNAKVFLIGEDTECEPNGKLIVKATKPISKGEEITVSYLENVPKKARLRKKLFERMFGFKCECKSCEKNIDF